jgi:Sigma-70 region 2
MTRAGEFEELRPLLFSIAYRLLGSVSEAEDAVQETWLRYDASPTEPRSARALRQRPPVTRTLLRRNTRFQAFTPDLTSHHLARTDSGPRSLQVNA